MKPKSTFASGARIVLAGGIVLLLCQGARAATTPNLLRNGNAEQHRCTRDWTAQTPVPGWRVVRGAASVLCYSAFEFAYEIPVLPAGEAPGQALFAAPGADTAIEQTVDLGPAAGAIDRGGVRYEVSAWLGGWRGRPERAALIALFLDEDGKATGAPVLLADVDAAARGGRTGLVARATQGLVPVRTRSISVTIEFVSGMSSFHNAYADNIHLTLDGDVAALAPAAPAVPPPVPPAAHIPPLDHVYLVMMENTNYADIVHANGRALSIDSNMPFLASLAQNGVLLTNMWATYHPSDQNYVAMIAGDTYRYGPVYYPDYDLAATHIGDLLDAGGRNWRAYVQHMNTPCNLAIDSNGGWYAPDDQPFAQFHDVIADPVRCIRTIRPLGNFETSIAAGDLPDFAWLAADGWWDGEGAWGNNFDVGYSLARQDEFLSQTFAPLLQSAQWKNSRSLLIVTWDESLGWGWPDNHVATVLVGSPGLLKAGAVVDTHYDGYGFLRTFEQALGVGSLGRFDEFAQPLNGIFAKANGEDGEDGDRSARDPAWSEDVVTRASLRDTFGRVAVPAAVERGQTATLLAPVHGGSGAVVLSPLGQAPAPDAARVRFAGGQDAIGIPTVGLAPGFYDAWILRDAALPAQAPLPLIVLPAPGVRPSAPGVEIVGAPGAHNPADALSLREGSNLIVRYCRPPGTTSAETWIGIFPTRTPASQLTQANAYSIGYWLYTPGYEPGQLCGEAMAFASELVPGTPYQVLLLLSQPDGTGAPIGSSANFALSYSLP